MWACRIATFFALLHVWAAAQCTIEGTVDIVWMIDASRDVGGTPGESEPLAQVRETMTKFAEQATMSGSQVRQSFVVFSGVVDPTVSEDWESFETIGPMTLLTDNEATSREAFAEAVDSQISIMGGSRDVPGAINFIRRNILTADRPNSRRLLIMVLSGPATDKFHNEASVSNTELALTSLYERGNVQTLLLTMGGQDAFPEDYLRTHVDFTFPSTYDSLVRDFIDSKVFCYFFETEAPVIPPTSTPQPTADPGWCHDLIRDGSSELLGRICAKTEARTVTLEYEAINGWQIESGHIWAGGDPTTIALDHDGRPILGTVSLNSLRYQIETSSMHFGQECDLYVIPSAKLKSASGGDAVVAYSGEVRFIPHADARILRIPIYDCEGTATPAPILPTPAPTPRPFNIDVFYASPFPDQYKAAMNRAIARVRNLFVNDFASEACFEQGSSWCGFTFTSSVCVDDVLIIFSESYLDGSGGRLAASGPCVVSMDTEQVRIGRLNVDSNDLAVVAADGRLEFLLIHQILHILGFGSRWQNWGVTSLASSGATYVGPKGVEGFRIIGGGASEHIPLDADGIHWQEETFGNELMTPTLVPNEYAVLSAMTVGSLQDIGLPVSMSRAESFRIPGRGGRRLEDERQRARSLLQTIGSSDVLYLPLQYTKYTTKNNREADLQEEIAFAQANYRLSRDPEPSNKTMNIGVIVGIVCAIFAFCALLTFFAVVRYQQGRSRPRKSPDLEKKLVTGPTLYNNWYERTDNDGRVYWINEDTGEFTYVPPESFSRATERDPSNAVSSFASAQRSMPRSYNGNWSEINDESAGPYYVNDDNEFSWVPQPGGNNGTRSFVVSGVANSPVRQSRSSGSSTGPLSFKTAKSSATSGSSRGLFSFKTARSAAADNDDSIVSVVVREPESPIMDAGQRYSTEVSSPERLMVYAAPENSYPPDDDEEAQVERFPSPMQLEVETMEEHIDDTDAVEHDHSTTPQYSDHGEHGNNNEGAEGVSQENYDLEASAITSYSNYDDSHLYESLPNYSARSRMDYDYL